MPFRSKVRLAASIALSVSLAGAGLYAASVALSPPWFAAVAVLAALLALLAADAFWPRVNLFAPAVVRIDGGTIRNPVALTFDDGPVSPYTAQILDILDRYGVKASFFCIGGNVDQNPDLARSIVSGGHTIGAHTATHRNLLLAGPGRVRRELEGGMESIRRATGLTPHFFRSPKGYKTPLVAMHVRRLRLRLVGYSYPIWDVQNPPPQELVDRVLRRVRPGDVIVMHDGYPPLRPGRRESLVEALPTIIEGMLERGLTPVSLDQLEDGN